MILTVDIVVGIWKHKLFEKKKKWFTLFYLLQLKLQFIIVKTQVNIRTGKIVR